MGFFIPRMGCMDARGRSRSGRFKKNSPSVQMCRLMLMIKFRFKFFLMLVLLLPIISVGYSAEKQLYIFGGGGDPKGPTTIFDAQLEVLSRFTSGSGNSWSTTHSFNGGHERTENLLKTKFPTAHNGGGFDQANFKSLLFEIEQKLESGDLKAGDQLMMLIDTHGATKGKNEKTHSIALAKGVASELKNLSGAQTISLDELDKITKLASEKGVKLALIDLSCFSGNSLKLSNQNICVISGSGENQYGYAEVREPGKKHRFYTFGGRFLEGMKKGVNLEDLFLNARAGSGAPDFPMISTDVGLEINDLIYKFITPYLLYNQASTTDFSETYIEAKSYAQAVCESTEKYNEIQKRIEEIKAMAGIPKKMLDMNKLTKALVNYRNYQLYYEKALGATHKAGAEIKDLINRDYPLDAKLFDKEDGLSILTVNRESSIKMYKEMLDSAKSEWSKKFYQKIYDELLLKDKISKEVSSKLSVASKASIKEFDEIFKHSYKTKELADDVSDEAKVVYDRLYKAKKSKESNACRDFVL